MDRATATALIDQLCRGLPAGDSPEADDFDYGWFRERVGSLVEQCPPEEGIYVWQYALWHLDRAGLLPRELLPFHRC